MHVLLTLLFLLQPQNVAGDNGVVTGVLRNAAGRPAAGVRVTAMAPPGIAEDATKGAALVSLAETDAEGRYRLENIPPGRYYIAAGRVDTPTYFPGTLELSGGNIVALSPASAVTDVDFVLKDESAGRAQLSGLMFFLPSLPGLTIPISVSVEGGGRVPVFSNGAYPKVRITEATNGQAYDATFGSPTVILPIPSGTTIDEYRVSVADLPEGYSVKSLRFGSSDLQKDPLKVSRLGLTISQSTLAAFPGPSAFSQTSLSVVLAGVPTASGTGGVRVRGLTISSGEVYLSDNWGILYEDGSFEFRNVPAGFHTIVKMAGATLAVAPIIVGSRDIENVRLQNTAVVPIDVFSDKSMPTAGKPQGEGQLALASVHGRIVDESSKAPLTEGVISVGGYGGSRRDYAIAGDGSFEVSQILPGTYNLTVHVSNYSNTPQQVTVGLEDFKLDLTARRASE